ncbi:unnamed protein product [Ceratitis capitata]|uniref:(Mediterranean fruit fly) hypothetical protein n=1 Tax=Ceratitis capitata TaxID=7213 RepID=A0A811U4C1_CERCA|nr:unnamed protein product [Ceratitis capitata]
MAKKKSSRANQQSKDLSVDQLETTKQPLHNSCRLSLKSLVQGEGCVRGQIRNGDIRKLIFLEEFQSNSVLEVNFGSISIPDCK